MTSSADFQDNRFHVVNSNDLEVLSSVCARIIRSHPLSDPLMKETVLVMNSGMQTYINQEIALQNKIASGIEYEQIWVFIWDLYKKIFREENGSEQTRLNCFSRDSIAWSLLGMKGLWTDPQSPLKDIFKPLREYVADDDESGLKTWKLCYRIADTLDQYQMNRPEWIRDFNKLTADDFTAYVNNPNLHGAVFKILRKMSPKRLKSAGDDIAPQVKQNVWQLKLWCMLRENLKGYTPENAGHFKFLDRVQIVDNLCRRLTDGGDELKPFLPERIFIMGVSSLPAQVLALFSALGRHSQVYLMLVNPCREYWGDLDVGRETPHSLKELQDLLRPRSRRYDDKELPGMLDLELDKDDPQDRYNEDGELEGGNALLTGLGRQGRDILSQLMSLDPVPAFINCFVRPERDSTLNALKDNLLTLDPSEKYVIGKHDDSLIFCNCHTRRREVEVLRDSILQKFHEAALRGEKLLPRDILVMTPNIEQYAAHIEAVFGGCDPASASFIPYSVGDRSVGREDPSAAAMLNLMAIGSTPVTLSFVMGLLAVPEIGEVFKIAPDEVEVLKDWCDRACIHWGLDASETATESGVADLPWTFERGLSRLIEGYMLGAQVPGSLDLIEGADVDLLGRFAAFIHALISLREFFSEYASADLHLERAHDPAGVTALERIRHEFFERFLGSVDQSEQALEFSRTLYGMCKILPELKSLPEITLPVLRSMLTESLSNKVDETAYLRGSVNFCSLMPMRAVPFRHIFILGLNELDFPRREHAPGFNLLSLSAFFRRGDRSRSVDDRYLFLEAILAAKESLTLSYVGQNPVEGTAMNPSAVVAELYDYLSDNFTCEGSDSDVKPDIRRRLTYNATLNSYDPRNFMKEHSQDGAGGEVHRMPSFDGGSFIEKLGEQDPIKRSPLGAAENFGVELQSPITLTMADLKAFFSSPCRSFLLSRGIRFEGLEASDNDKESFALDLLQAAVLKLQCSADSSDDEVVRTLGHFDKSGLLPYGLFKERSEGEIRDFCTRVRKLLHEECLKEGFDPALLQSPVRLPFDSGFIRASDLFTADELASYRIPEDLEISIKDEVAFPAVTLDPYSKSVSRPKAAFEVALNALGQALCCDPHRPKMLSLWCVQSGVTRYAPLSSDDARDFLHLLLKWRLIGMTRPLPIWSDLLKGAIKAPGKKAYEFATAEFNHDDNARYLFEDPEILNHDNETMCDKRLAKLAENFTYELVVPFIRDPLYQNAEGQS